MTLGCLLSRNHRKSGLVDLLRVTHPSSAVNSTTPLDFRARGLSDSGLVLTCCEFRPRRGNALGIRKRVESLLCKQWNPEQLRAGSRVRRDGVSVVSGWAVLLIWTSAGAVPPTPIYAARSSAGNAMEQGPPAPDLALPCPVSAIIRFSRDCSQKSKKILRKNLLKTATLAS